MVLFSIMAYHCKHLIYVKQMAIRRLLRRLIVSLALSLPAAAVLADNLNLPQVSNLASKNVAPDPRLLEAQRRLALSRRRRADEAVADAQYVQLMTASLSSQIAEKPRPRHREVGSHRSTTPLGRKAVRSATPPRVNPPVNQ